MQQFSGHLDVQIASNLAYSGKLYYNSIEDDRRVTYTGYAGSSAPPAAPVERGAHRLDEYPDLAGQPASCHRRRLQLRAPGQSLSPLSLRLCRPDRFSTPVTTSNDDSHTLDNFGAYVQAIIKPNASWKIVPAIRTDSFKGHTTLNATGQTFPLQDYGWINQPKLSVVYSPSPAFSLYGNWGRTFQIVTGSRSPAYLTTGTAVVKPSINTGIELGTKFRLASAPKHASPSGSRTPPTKSPTCRAPTQRRTWAKRAARGSISRSPPRWPTRSSSGSRTLTRRPRSSAATPPARFAGRQGGLCHAAHHHEYRHGLSGYREPALRPARPGARLLLHR
jgi:hypothetical protein